MSSRNLPSPGSGHRTLRGGDERSEHERDRRRGAIRQALRRFDLAELLSATTILILVVTACHDELPTEAHRIGTEPSESDPSGVVRSYPGGCVPEATVTFEGDKEVTEINFTPTDGGSGCVIDASQYGVELADPTASDTPQGDSEWQARSGTEVIDPPSPSYAAEALYSPYQAFIEFGPPARSVTFHYSSPVENAWWDGELVTGVDSMKVCAVSHGGGGFYNFWDCETLHANAEDWNSLDTWTPVTLSASWDAIEFLWFDGPAYIDDLVVRRSAPPALVCDTVVRGHIAACEIARTVDEVVGWEFRGPLPLPLAGQPDTFSVGEPSPATSWSGTAVLSGTVAATVVMNGGADTTVFSGDLVVLDRPEGEWRWGEEDWSWQDSTPAASSQCTYSPFYAPIDTSAPAAGRLSVNRPTDTCVPTHFGSIYPNPPAADSGYLQESVVSGPNDGLHYVTSASFYMDRMAEMNPFLSPTSPTRDTLTDNSDVRDCEKWGNYPKNQPVVTNWWEFNEKCKKNFSLDPFFAGLWAHEGLGDQSLRGTSSANGHEARRRFAANKIENDPEQIVERIVNVDTLTLRLSIWEALRPADQRIMGAADSAHQFVKDNYTSGNKCGEVAVLDTLQQSYFDLQVETGPGTCM